MREYLRRNVQFMGNFGGKRHMSTNALIWADTVTADLSFPGKLERMSGNEARARLETQRLRLLEQMVRESDEAERRVLLDTYQALGMAIDSLPDPQRNTKYGKFKQIRGAIEAYLRETGRAVQREDIVNALYDGGVRRVPKNRPNPTTQEMDEETRTIIRKSISFHLENPRGIAANVLREENGLVGLFEWPDERFR